MKKGDSETSIQELKDLVVRFSQDRHWQKHHKPKNFAHQENIDISQSFRKKYQKYSKNIRLKNSPKTGRTWTSTKSLSRLIFGAGNEA